MTQKRSDRSDHAALMDHIYSVQRHFYDLTRPLFLFGREQLVRSLAPPPGGTILEVGCGTARNLVHAGHAWPGTRLYGLDISEAMLATAGRSIDRNGLSDRTVLKPGDAGSLDTNTLFGVPKVDRIFFSYTLSMMPSWRDALAQAAASLAPGGSLHILDFGQYDRLPRILRDLHFGSLRTSHVFPRHDLRDELERLAGELDLSLEFTSLYRGYACGAVLRRTGRYDPGEYSRPAQLATAELSQFSRNMV